MRLRMQDANGDYVFGRSAANFFVNSAAGVAQLVRTRLLLWEGEWYINTTDGTPYSTEILGTGTQSLYDLAIQERVLSTPNVTSIESYESSRDPVTRKLTVEMTVMTTFSTTPEPLTVTL